MLFYSSCDSSTLGGCTNINSFIEKIEETSVFREVSATCKFLSPCVDECVETVSKYINKDPCMSGTVWKYARVRLLVLINAVFHAVTFLQVYFFISRLEQLSLCC